MSSEVAYYAASLDLLPVVDLHKKRKYPVKIHDYMVVMGMIVIGCLKCNRMIIPIHDYMVVIEQTMVVIGMMR